MKLKTTYLLLFIGIFTFSFCDESKTIATVCNVENPLEDFAFLKEAKNSIDVIDCGGKSSITQYTYNSEIVFEVNICDQIADGQTIVYNCSGETVCIFGGIAGQNTCPDFEDNATNKILLYGN
ncbi:hypothetical protein [uncultured Polaribacter sp.]|uniref:DUF6970 domain-containing protein n=1 Tax=uncultured Polaribacter sp. TaxID=174711 RepID=UPI00261601D8|nr:hypothetical protein [uncultured Polaribacter sp.]